MEFVGGGCAVFGVRDVFFAEELFDLVGADRHIAPPRKRGVSDGQLVVLDGQGGVVDEHREGDVGYHEPCSGVDQREEVEEQRKSVCDLWAIGDESENKCVPDDAKEEQEKCGGRKPPPMNVQEVLFLLECHPFRKETFGRFLDTWGWSLGAVRAASSAAIAFDLSGFLFALLFVGLGWWAGDLIFGETEDCVARRTFGDQFVEVDIFGSHGMLAAWTGKLHRAFLLE